MEVLRTLKSFVMSKKLKPMRLKKVGTNTNKSYTEWMKYIHKTINKLTKNKIK